MSDVDNNHLESSGAIAGDPVTVNDAEKFTPGPWRVERGMGEPSWVSAVIEPKDGGDIICEAPSGYCESMIRWESNADLIAAAPDLYAALDRLLHETMYRDHPGASQLAIDALKKARGES